MPSAADVLRDTRAILQQAEGQIRNHPYLAALGSGGVSLEALRAFPGHQYHMWQSDRAAAARLVERFGYRSYGSFFVGDLQAEDEARAGILTMAHKLGMSEVDLDHYEPSAEGFAYAAYLTWLSVHGSAAEAACGMTLNLAAWGHNCGQVSRALREHYGFAKDETSFLDGFADLPSFEDTALQIIQEDLDRGVPPRKITRAARMIQSYERMFWDAMDTVASAS